MNVNVNDLYSLVGLLIPYAQYYINQAITDELKIWKLSITIKDQKILLTSFLSLLLGVAVCVINKEINMLDIPFTAMQVFAASQFAYYTHLRKIIK